MTENNDNPIENSIETISVEDSAYVEDFRIRPITVGDEVEMDVLMHLGGGKDGYYLHATARYANENSGHEIRIERAGGDLVNAFEVPSVTDSPSELREAVQAMHETYVQAYEDWYAYAVAADEAVGE